MRNALFVTLISFLVVNLIKCRDPMPCSDSGGYCVWWYQKCPFDSESTADRCEDWQKCCKRQKQEQDNGDSGCYIAPDESPPCLPPPYWVFEGTIIGGIVGGKSQPAGGGMRSSCYPAVRSGHVGGRRRKRQSSWCGPMAARGRQGPVMSGGTDGGGFSGAAPSEGELNWRPPEEPSFGGNDIDDDFRPPPSQGVEIPRPQGIGDGWLGRNDCEARGGFCRGFYHGCPSDSLKSQLSCGHFMQQCCIYPNRGWLGRQAASL